MDAREVNSMNGDRKTPTTTFATCETHICTLFPRNYKQQDAELKCQVTCYDTVKQGFSMCSLQFNEEKE